MKHPLPDTSARKPVRQEHDAAGGEISLTSFKMRSTWIAGFVAVLATLLLAGCYLVSYEDVSSEPKYASYVGAEYRTTANMTVYRVSMDQNYGPSPSVYKIVQPPGFDGPEVISRTRFPEGSTMKVLTIQRCTDCYLDTEPRVHATVRVTSTTQFDDLEVRADLGLLSSHMQTMRQPDPGSR